MKKIFLTLIATLICAWVSPWQAVAADATVATAEDGDDEDDDDVPYIEPAYTVYFDIDNADAVYLTVNDKPIAHTAGINAITVDPGDGYIKAHVVEGYAFTKFDDIDTGASYLQYDRQTSPVTVRRTVAVSNEERVDNDGHTFAITTFDMASLATYNLSIDVDDASLVEVRIGPSINIESSANHTVDLADGLNAVTYAQGDGYLHVRSASFTYSIYSVTFNDKPAITDGAFWPTYTVYLKDAKTDGGRLVITAKAPEVPTAYSFTAFIEDAECVRYISRKPERKDFDFVTGENTLTFNDGDYFEVWCTRQAESCTFNGEEVPFDSFLTAYIFTPTPDGRFEIRFAPEVPPVPTFTFMVDDASAIDYLMNDATEEEFELVDGENIIPIANPGDSFCVGTVRNVEAYSFTIDGEDVPRVRRIYEFFPEEGSYVEVLFAAPAANPEYAYTINIDDASDVVVYTGNSATSSSTIALTDGANALTIATSPTDPVIKIAPAIGACIDSVTSGAGYVHKCDSEGVYTINVTDGMTITIATHKIVYDSMFTMIIDGSLADLEMYGMVTGANREIELHEGINEIPFNADYDRFVIFAFAPDAAAVYVGDTPIYVDDEWEAYYYEPVDGDVVRVYLTDTLVEGDVNGDGNADIADAQRVLNIMSGSFTPGFGEHTGDVNADGEVNIADVQRVLNAMSGN